MRYFSGWQGPLFLVGLCGVVTHAHRVCLDWNLLQNHRRKAKNSVRKWSAFEQKKVHKSVKIFLSDIRHEYLLADKNMSIIPVAFSLMASFMSAISLMGLTREIYTFGTQFIAINFGYILGTPLSAYLFLPVFFRYIHSNVKNVSTLRG